MQGTLQKRDSEMLKMRFKKRVAFVPSLLPKHISKPSFQQSAFRVSCNIIFSFSHKFWAYNAICCISRCCVIRMNGR